MRFPVLLVMALLLAGCAAPSTPDATTTPGPGDATDGDAQVEGPEWAFTSIEGERVSRDEPPRNATVLFFMATWCSSCKSRAPTIADVNADYEPVGVRTFSVTVDPSERAEDLAAWKERYAQPWPHGIDEDLRISRAFGVTSQSSVAVLDADGQLVRLWGYGQVTDAALRSELDALLAAQA